MASSIQQTAQLNSNDDIIPLLLAANEGIKINYRKLSALDEHGRSESLFEQRFRKWKARAKELIHEAGTRPKQPKQEIISKPPKMDDKTVPSGQHGNRFDKAGENPDIEGTSGKKSKFAGKNSPRVTTVQSENPQQPTRTPESILADIHLSDQENLTQKPISKSEIMKPSEHVGSTSGEPLSPVKSSSTFKVAAENEEGEQFLPTKSKGTRKRAEQDVEIAAMESPAKKPKFAKKGIARIVKKVERPRYDDSNDDEPEKSEPKPKKANGKGTRSRIQTRGRKNPQSSPGKGGGQEVEMEFDFE